LLQVLAVAVVFRWLTLRLRRVLLLPTGDTTDPIVEAQIKRMRRIIISDVHLGAADRRDDFDGDNELVSFIRTYVMRNEPVELILAGDTFEFLQVRLPELSDYEWSGEAAAKRLQAILIGHPDVIAALRDFIAQPDNLLTLLIGNHDFELHYAAAKHVLRRALGVSDADERLRFGISYEGGGMYLEHGNQFDSWNRFVHFSGITKPFEVVRGTRVVKDVINPMEDDPLDVAPLIDNVKPTSAFLWYMLSLPRLRDPHARSYVVRGVLRMFRTVALPTVYNTRPVLEVREELLGEPGHTLQREMALQAAYELEPAMQEAAAVRHGGEVPKVKIRPRATQRVAEVADVARRLARNRGETDTALAELQDEAGRQLRQEMREFKNETQRAMGHIAASPEHSHNTLFVCGHTHLAEVVPLGNDKTYVNTGTWTAVVRNVAAKLVEQRRFSFLEIDYDTNDRPQGRLLVWHGPDVAPQEWTELDGTDG
jgi:UDP-2,3-diacylglucosamine pyrophosphatase LpxH